jgi:UTP--glucose-1-phosphate uridylyltransferase
LINKCLFPAAGYGTRFLPATKAVPKEMLPILTKPLLQYAVEEALSAGISNMAIVTGRGKRSIEDHFDNSYEIESQLKGTNKEHLLEEIQQVVNEATFTYIRQQEMLGLGHAVLTGEPLIGNEAFAVSLADDLCDSKKNGFLSQMIEVYSKYNCSVIAIEEIDYKDTKKYGIISGDLIDGTNDIFLVKDLIEKPDEKFAPSNLAVIGRYILTPDIFNILKNLKPGVGGEIQLTDALAEQAKYGKVVALKVKGDRFDCGNLDGFLKATFQFAKKLGMKLD